MTSPPQTVALSVTTGAAPTVNVRVSGAPTVLLLYSSCKPLAFTSYVQATDHAEECAAIPPKPVVTGRAPASAEASWPCCAEAPRIGLPPPSAVAKTEEKRPTVVVVPVRPRSCRLTGGQLMVIALLFATILSALSSWTAARILVAWLGYDTRAE